MARNVYYDAPDLLARAATHATGQATRRINIDKSIDRALEVGIQNARLAQDANQAQQAAERDAAILQQRDRENAQRLAAAQQANEADNQRMAEIAGATRQEQVRNRQTELVAAGLKSGQYYYTPKATQDMATISNQITQVQSDESIAPDTKNRMLDQLTTRMDQIRLSPAMRVTPPPPKPSEEFKSGSALYSPSTKKIYDHDDPNIPPDAVIAPKDRNGVYKPIPDKKQDNSPAAFYGKHENILTRKTDLTEQINARYKTEYDAAYKAWEKKLDALSGTSADEGVDMTKRKGEYNTLLANPPQPRFANPQEVDALVQQEMRAAGVLPEGPTVVMPDSDFAEPQAAPPLSPVQAGYESIQRTAGAGTQVRSGRSDTPPSARPQVQQPPVPQLVRVNTPEEAMRLPPGTTFVTPDGRVKVRP